MIEFIMNLLGFENINKIRVPEEYKIPRAEKLKCKVRFYNKTGKFHDKIIINNQKLLLDGYTTYLLCKWIEKKYVKVIKINAIHQDFYNELYKGYKSNEKIRRCKK